MYKHAPEGYFCPFCALLRGTTDPRVGSSPDDIFYRDDHLTALISLHAWKNNHGNAILIPNEHYENLYDLPDVVGARIFALSRRVALAMKAAYTCDGISTRQHNEPAGNQDVFHYHLHVFPRYTGDNLYQTLRSPAPEPAEERKRYAALLKKAMESV